MQNIFSEVYLTEVDDHNRELKLSLVLTTAVQGLQYGCLAAPRPPTDTQGV